LLSTLKVILLTSLNTVYFYIFSEYEQGLHPFHVQRIQTLQPARNGLLSVDSPKIHEAPNFLGQLLTTDEAGFTREKVFNNHNTHVWSDENPHRVIERRFQEQFSINVGCTYGRE
jgi:hypothetical protein